MPTKNLFLDVSRAQDYSKSRPSFHQEGLKAYHQKDPEVMYEHALDVGCGTGQSTLALAKWSKQVTGIDNSQSMLDHAVSDPKIKYQLADAENMPFEPESFDLLFAASSLHWFEKRKFLNQVSKVLKSRGTFLIYDTFVTKGLSPEFSKTYSSRFPRPFQDVRFTEAELEFFDLKFVKLHTFDFVSRLVEEDIALYFYNLSNVTASIEKGDNPDKALDDIRTMVKMFSTGTPYIFQVVMTEILKL